MCGRYYFAMPLFGFFFFFFHIMICIALEYAKPRDFESNLILGFGAANNIVLACNRICVRYVGTIVHGTLPKVSCTIRL